MTYYFGWVEKNGKRVSGVRLFSIEGVMEQCRRFKSFGPVPGLRLVFERTR